MQLSSCIHHETSGDCEKMSSLIVPRRQLLRGLASLAVCAPAVVRASSLMGISAKYCAPAALLPWATAQNALALLQQEMERQFAETLFGEDGRPAEAEEEEVLPALSPLGAEAKMTALWELRSWFGPRGSPSRRFEELPIEVQAALVSMFDPAPRQGRVASYLTTPLEAGT